MIVGRPRFLIRESEIEVDGRRTEGESAETVGERSLGFFASSGNEKAKGEENLGEDPQMEGERNYFLALIWLVEIAVSFSSVVASVVVLQSYQLSTGCNSSQLRTRFC